MASNDKRPLAGMRVIDLATNAKIEVEFNTARVA